MLYTFKMLSSTVLYNRTVILILKTGEMVHRSLSIPGFSHKFNVFVKVARTKFFKEYFCYFQNDRQMFYVQSIYIFELSNEQNLNSAVY